jgi:hypothetical protein
MRVGRFVGRLGVVSLPAVSVGLDIDERVVRRHVSKLEAAGWLGRAPWIWGEGSVVWLTSAGIEFVGLGGVRPIKAPPSNTLTSHAVLVGWSAARLERRARVWKSVRELAVDSERWTVRARCERGYTTQLPDLVGWIDAADLPIAVIAESGGRREDRQKWILEGWRDAILDGRYGGVRYDCATESVAQWIRRLARKVHLTPPTISVAVQTSPDEIAAVSSADRTEAKPPAGEATQQPADRQPTETVQARAAAASAPLAPLRTEPRRAPEPRTPEAVAERERILREVLGIEEPKPRRWRRR